MKRKNIVTYTDPNTVIDHELHRKIELLRLSTLITGAALTVFTIVSLIEGYYVRAIVDSAILGVLIVNYILYLFTKKVSPALLVAFAAIAALLTFDLTQGMGTALWTFTLPWLSFLVLGKRKGIWANIFFFLVICLLFYSNAIYRYTEFNRGFAIRFPAVYIVMAFFAYYYETITNSIQEKLEQQAKVIQQSEQRYRTLVYTSPIPILVYSDEVIIFANNAAVKTLHANSAGELIGKPVVDFIHPDYRQEFRSRTLVVLPNKKGPPPAKEQWITCNGDTIDVECRKTAIDYQEKAAVQTFFIDITERKRLEDQIRQSEKMQAVGQLAGGIAHDFNNQLQGIMGYSEMLVEMLRDNEPLVRYARNIFTGVKRTADLTNQLLAFARKGKYLSVTVDLHEIIGEVVTLIKHGIDTGITIIQHLDAPNPVTTGDPRQIQNAFLNLALNARDAMPKGGSLIFSTEIISVDEEYREYHNLEITYGTFIKTDVTDTGAGIDPQMKAHVFEPFFSTKGLGKGTGMGLASAYGIIKNHKGTIWFTSEVGKGTTFTILLPQTTQENDE